MSIPSGQAPEVIVVAASGLGPPPATISDLELISRIKNDNDSAATISLVHNHTGIYMSVLRKYEAYPDFRARANINDLREDKFINIYNWALKYDPNRATESGRPMQFGTYVGQMAKYLCRGIISKAPDNVEFDEKCDGLSTDDTVAIVETHSSLEEALAEVSRSECRLFKKIFNLRHKGGRLMSWRQIAKKTNMSHEGVRKMYNRYIQPIRESKDS